MLVFKDSNHWLGDINKLCQQRCSISHLPILYFCLLIITSIFLSGCLGEGREESYQECYTCDDLDCVPPAEEIRYISPEVVEIEMIAEGI